MGSLNMHWTRTIKLAHATMALAATLAGSRQGMAACPSVAAPWPEVRWLQQRREDYRAAGLALSEVYLASTARQRSTALQCLTSVYMGAGQWGKALESWAELRGSIGVESQDQWHLGEAVLTLRRTDVAVVDSLPGGLVRPMVAQSDERVRLWLKALYAIRRHQWHEAGETFAGLHADCGLTAPDRSPACLAARRGLLGLQQSPTRRSIWLATTLSALVPGAGFLYADHAFDALAYGASTWTAGWLTYSTRDRHAGLIDQPVGTYVLGATTLFLYVANLVATHDTVQRANEVHDWQYEMALTVGAWPQLPELHLPAPATADK